MKTKPIALSVEEVNKILWRRYKGKLVYKSK